MSIEHKMSQLDSLERIEIELEIEKKLEKKTEEKFRQILKECLPVAVHNIDRIIEALDKRYIRRP